MFEKFKSQLQVGGWLLVAVLALLVVWLAQAIDNPSSANASNVITVSGTGKVTATPDVAVADLAITVTDSTAKAAQNNATKKSQTVVDYLKKAGVDDKDIKTTNYNIYPQYDYTNGKSILSGYQVTETLEVKVRDLDKANDILDGVVTAGVNQVNNFRFDIDKPDDLQAQARKMAIDDAQAKADVLKGQLGVRLGKITSFSESGGTVPPIIYARDTAGIGGMGGGGPSIPTGENEVSVSVTITYQIK